MSLFIWILLVYFLCYILNRVLWWVGSFLWDWSKNVIFLHEYWYDEGTTLREIVDNIKYKDPINSPFKYIRIYNDAYEYSYYTRWIPLMQLYGIFSGIIMILGFISTLIFIILKFIFYIIYLIIYFSWKYCISHVCIFIYKKFRLKNIPKIIDNINSFYNKIVDEILNIKIA